MLDASSTWTAIAFWSALALVIRVWIYSSAEKRKRALATIQSAFERGQPLDAQTVRLLPGDASPVERRRDLRLQALVWLAIGAGLLIFALVGFPRMHSVIAGLSGILICLGLALFVASRLPIGSEPDGSK